MRIIHDIAEDLGCSYVYDDFARINLHADKCDKWPMVAEVISVDGTIDTKFLPAVKAVRNVQVAFFTPIPLDYTGREAGEAVDCMLALAMRFLRRLGEEIPDTLPDNIKYNAVLNYLNENLAGILLTIPAEKMGECE